MPQLRLRKGLGSLWWLATQYLDIIFVQREPVQLRTIWQPGCFLLRRWAGEGSRLAVRATELVGGSRGGDLIPPMKSGSKPRRHRSVEDPELVGRGPITGTEIGLTGAIEVQLDANQCHRCGVGLLTAEPLVWL